MTQASAQLAGGLVTAGSAGGRFRITFSSRDGAFLNNKQMDELWTCRLLR